MKGKNIGETLIIEDSPRRYVSIKKTHEEIRFLEIGTPETFSQVKLKESTYRKIKGAFSGDDENE